MFGAVSSTIDEVTAIISSVCEEDTGAKRVRFSTGDNCTLGILYDASPESQEGFCRSNGGSASAVVSGSLGTDGRMLVADDAASLLLELAQSEALDLTRLNGLFVGALWQPGEGRLTLVSDWIGGLNQIFYARSPDGIVFGTRAGAVVNCAAGERAVNRATLAQYLDFGHSLPPNTLFEGVGKLPAGCELTFIDGDLRIRRSFRLKSRSGDGDSDLNDDAAGRFRETHRNAVGRCLLSSENVGAFLSGGIDSGMNVAAMSEWGAAPIKTFSVTYPGEQIDESRYARLVSDRFHTEHHELPLESAAVLDELPEMVWALEEPAMDHSFVPTFHLARFAREHVPTVLSGDGPDHLFGRHYPVALVRGTIGRLPGARRLAAALLPPGERSSKASRLWRSLRRRESGRLLWKALQSVGSDSVQAYLSIYREIACRGLLPERPYSLLAHPEQVPAVNGQVDPLVADVAGPDVDEFERTIALDLMIDGSCGVFSKVGKMAAHHGLTVHEPYLDSDVRTLVEALPAHLKAAGSLYDLLRGRLRRKVLVYQAARGVLPEEVLDKPKQGFEAPISQWLNEWLDGRDAAGLLPALTRETSLLDEGKVNALLREHTDGTSDHGTLIMMLVTLDLWYAIFVLGDARRPDWRWSDRLGGR